LSRLMVARIRVFLILVVVTGLVGLLDGLLGYLPGGESQFVAIMQNTVDWSVGGTLVWSFEIFVVPSRFGVGIRHLHFLAAIAVKSLIIVAIVVLVTLLTRVVWEGIFDLRFFWEIDFYRSLLFVFLVISIMQTVIQVVRIVGGRALINFVLGKYLQPVRENKIFMFLDLVGSTALSEKLGDIGVQAMITNFFFDIAEPIAEHGGEIHRYVGDQIVVTWPLKEDQANLRAIRCCFAIAERVREKGAKFERKFGTIPRFRIGLHGGPVVISQCGDNKQEISYFGDTVNTAARIEQQCKNLDCSLLLSGDLLAKIEMPADLSVESKGNVQLRGREQMTELFTVVPK
jgi:adenylate cyclase